MKIIGLEIELFRVRSFYLNNELMTKNLKIYMKFKNIGWFSLVIADGKIYFENMKEEPIITSLIEINDDFAYPIRSAEELDKFTNQKIKRISEYHLKKAPELALSVGWCLEFEESTLSLIEFDEDDDEGLTIIEGISDEALQFSFLKVFDE